MFWCACFSPSVQKSLPSRPFTSAAMIAVCNMVCAPNMKLCEAKLFLPHSSQHEPTAMAQVHRSIRMSSLENQEANHLSAERLDCEAKKLWPPTSITTWATLWCTAPFVWVPWKNQEANHLSAERLDCEAKKLWPPTSITSWATLLCTAPFVWVPWKTKRPTIWVQNG